MRKHMRALCGMVLCFLALAQVAHAEPTAEVEKRVQQLLEGDARTQAEAAQTLQLAGSASVTPLLTALKASSDPKQQAMVLRVLGSLGVAAQSALEPLRAMRLSVSAAIQPSLAEAIRQIEAYQDCGLSKLPPGTKLYFAGGYSGMKSVDVQLGGNGHDVHQTDIVISETQHPVALVLGAYDPVVWRIGRVRDAKLAGVLIFGYEPQAVIGIEKSVPYRIQSSTQRSGGCPSVRIGYENPDLQSELDLIRLTGVPLERVVRKGTDRLIVGPDTILEGDILYSDDTKIEQFGKVSAVPAGKRGIEFLLEQKKIRRATAEDWSAWSAGVKAKGQPAQGTPDPARFSGGYVVIGEMEFPAGLYGAHSETFIIPADVPEPKGNAGHSGCFYMKDFVSGMCSR